MPFLMLSFKHVSGLHATEQVSVQLNSNETGQHVQQNSTKGARCSQTHSSWTFEEGGGYKGGGGDK
jgi:hypothetical protein